MQPKRGGAGRGQGRKPKDASGELMTGRVIRMTDAQWSDAKLIGMDEVRRLVTERAAKMLAR